MSYAGKNVGQSLSCKTLTLSSGDLTIDATAANTGALQGKLVHKADMTGATQYGSSVLEVQDQAGQALYDLALNGQQTGTGDAGADLRLNAYDDAGSLVGVALSVDRATAKVDFPKGVAGAIEGSVISGADAAYNAAGGAATVSAAQLIDGYVYNGTAGGSVALTLPSAADLVTALAAENITPAAGTQLRPLVVRVTDANALTVTPGSGGSVAGSGVVNNTMKTFYPVFTAADAYILIDNASA